MLQRSCFFGHCHLVMVLLELHRHCVDCSETFGTIYKLGGRGEAVVARREHVRIRPLSERQERKKKSMKSLVFSFREFVHDMHAVILFWLGLCGSVRSCWRELFSDLLFYFIFCVLFL